MNVEKIIKNNICAGCGTCAGICPNNAIEMKINEKGFFIPFINKKKCTQCGLCSKVCPQINRESFDELNKFIFGKSPQDKVIGDHINCYTCYSTDEKLRFEASSGGMITQILITAIEEGIINGALVTRMKKDDPLIPEPFIARTKEEIIEAMGSKYCPVPLNIMIRKILSSKNDEKFAVVGLPCHITGIRKAEMLNPNLKKKVILHLGLLCGGVKSFFGTEYILSQIGLKKTDIKNLKYRGNGWPGYLQIQLNNGTEQCIPFSSLLYYGGMFGILFTNRTCVFCKDHISMLSDISFGDAHHLEKIDTKGKSLVIVRTKKGDTLMKDLLVSGKIEIIERKEQFVLRSQGPIINLTKQRSIKMHKKVIYLLLSHSKKLVKFVLSYFSTHEKKIIRKIFLFPFSMIYIILTFNKKYNRK